MKAIIPVAGIGTRLRPHTHTQPKSLIPVAGKPILAHIVDQLVSEGFTDFVFIIGYLGDKIEDYIVSNYPGINATFVIQTVGKGTGHAIWLAKDAIGKDEEIFIVLGDTICEINLKKVLSDQHSSLGVKKVDDPRQFGVAETDKDGFITKLVEKPNIPKSNLALVGLYKIKESAQLMNCLQHNIENNVRTQGEFHLTDGLMCMILQGVKFSTFDVESWFDCGKKEILLQTNQLLLKRGNFTSYEAENVENSIIVPPVYFGKGSKIRNSIIGPNVSIGEDTIIESSIIKESIIGPYAHLEHAVLQNSLIGNDASLYGTIYSLNLGDSAEINFK
ncbi:MAG: NTP transferase domain-containing protein [Bacteroidia bacterium]|nr:NTP transferase domain-containing protein [Bacteroidia bacterium]